MRKLVDKKTGLVWYAVDSSDFREDGSLKTEISKDLRDLKLEMNDWKTECGIKKFITWEDVGDYIFGQNHIKNMYFAFEDGKFSGVSVIQQNQGFDEDRFCHHIKQCERTFSYDPRFLSEEKARIALINAEQDVSNNIYYKYLIVAPDCRGKGIGTRSVMSVMDKNNTLFFSGTENINVTHCRINYANKPSQKVFERNGFGRLYDHGMGEPDEMFDYYYVADNCEFDDLLMI